MSILMQNTVCIPGKLIYKKDGIMTAEKKSQRKLIHSKTPLGTLAVYVNSDPKDSYTTFEQQLPVVPCFFF